MKLSDVKGERTLDVIADIIEPICNIAEDEKAVELFKKEKVPEGKSARQYAADRLKRGVPTLIKTHRKDIISILASIEGVKPKEYAKTLNLAKLLHDFSELVTDDEFLGFFVSEGNEDSYGDVSVNTGAH